MLRPRSIGFVSELFMDDIERPEARRRDDIAKQFAKEGKPEAYRKLRPGYRYRPKIVPHASVSYRTKLRLAHADAKRIRKLLPISQRRKPHDAYWFAAQLHGVDDADVRAFSESGPEGHFSLGFFPPPFCMVPPILARRGFWTSVRNLTKVLEERQ